MTRMNGTICLTDQNPGRAPRGNENSHRAYVVLGVKLHKIQLLGRCTA